MSTVDRLLAELKKQSEQALQQIAQASYGAPTHDLWELIGSIKATAETNLFLIEGVKQEMNLEQIDQDD